MSESEPEEGNGRADETLPPGSDEPEADALEQQLRPDSGESPEGDEPEEPLQEKSPRSAFEANDADMIEQERAVEFTDDDNRE